MPKPTVALDRDDLNPILDLLRQPMDSYNLTANFLNDEDHNLENHIIEEVTNAAEARTIAKNFQRIIEEIARQLPA